MIAHFVHVSERLKKLAMNTFALEIKIVALYLLRKAFSVAKIIMRGIFNQSGSTIQSLDFDEDSIAIHSVQRSSCNMFKGQEISSYYQREPN